MVNHEALLFFPLLLFLDFFHPLPHLYSSFPSARLEFLALTPAEQRLFLLPSFVVSLVSYSLHCNMHRLIQIEGGGGGGESLCCSEFHLTSGNHLLSLFLPISRPLFSVALCCNVNSPVIILLPLACRIGWCVCVCV